MIIDYNKLGNLVEKLNKELFFKITEVKTLAGEAEDYDYLIFVSNGQNVTVKFLGVEIWNSQVVEKYESNIPVEKQIDFLESDDFESHVRQLITDELDALSKVTML